MRIEDFDITDRAEAHAEYHGVSRSQIFSVLESAWIAVRNRHDRAADYLLLGRDFHGQCLAIPIKRTTDPLLWQPRTAWHCKKGEETILRKARG